MRKRLTLALASAGIMALAAVGGGAMATNSGRNAGSSTKLTELRAGISPAQPKNVIFFLGDGMGVSEITSARYYQYGATGRMNVDRLRFTGLDTNSSLKPGTGSNYLPDYVPDSAATGTEWATGQRTIDDRVSQGPSSALSVPGSNEGYETVLELAQEQGKRTGDVSTAELTDATPAVLASHMSNRACQGPTDTTSLCPTETKAAGGLGSIAEQEVDHGVDVLLGGGRARFAQTTGNGKTVIQSAQQQGYRYATSASELAAIDSSRRKPVLGLFNNGNMSLEWSGPASSTGTGNSPAVRCTTGQRPTSEPSLPAMTRKALALLGNNNRKGFFLQVEGASIDKQDHATNACGQIGETIAFDDAIGTAIDYQKTHPETLIVVSADHSHTSQIVPEDATGANAPTGYSTNLLTKDGQTMRLTYGTSGYGGAGAAPVAAPPSQQHTGAAVPVWANGPGAGAVLGTNDHTDLFDTLQGEGF